MIVDDDAAFALVLQEILEEQGYEVKAAGNGKDGYCNYLLFEPDLVITDILMPVWDGLELIKHIRARDPWVKAIYMSADLNRFRSVLKEERQRYHAHLLEKPFSRVELLSLLPQHES